MTQRGCFWTVLVLSYLSAACTLFMSKEAIYLRSAQDRAIQEEVRRQLGEPHAMTTTPAGEVLWLYAMRDIEPMRQSSWSTLGSWCEEYRLTFDRSEMLRAWTHRSFVHGGELMPESCTSGVEKPAW